jgi:hypothetical protein
MVPDDYTITPTFHEGDDGLVHIRVELEVPVHPSYLSDAASSHSIAKAVGLDVTAKLMEKFEEAAAGPQSPA